MPVPTKEQFGDAINRLDHDLQNLRDINEDEEQQASYTAVMQYLQTVIDQWPDEPDAQQRREMFLETLDEMNDTRLEFIGDDASGEDWKSVAVHAGDMAAIERVRDLHNAMFDPDYGASDENDQPAV